MKAHLYPSSIEGKLEAISSNSQSIRALLFSLMAKGTSVIDNILDSRDVNFMINACEKLGAEIKKEGKKVRVAGTGGKLTPCSFIDAGNSGQILRFLGALCALSSHHYLIKGDQSCVERRIVEPLFSGIMQLGGSIFCPETIGRPPYYVRGPISSGYALIDGMDSQPVSALLMAASFLPCKTIIEVINPQETDWIDVTLSWLERMGVSVKNDSYKFYEVRGKKEYSGFDLSLTGDIRSSSYAMVAAILSQKPIKISKLWYGDFQGDWQLIDLFRALGQNVTVSEDIIQIEPKPLKHLPMIDVAPFVDSLPLVVVLSCFMPKKVILHGGAVTRFKESDRIQSIAQELKKMGAKTIEKEDGLEIYPSQLHGEVVSSCHDHRIAMSLVVAATQAQGVTIIEDVEWIEKSYPGFFDDMKKVGLKGELIP